MNDKHAERQSNFTGWNVFERYTCQIGTPVFFVRLSPDACVN